MSELYELPEGWEWKSLDEFTTIKSGKRVPKGYKLSEESTPYPYIRVTDFNNYGSVDTDDIRYISEDIYQKIKNYTITDKDIYISVAGTIGKTGIIPSELNGANLTENAVKIVFDNELYDKRFLLNFTNSIVFMEQVGLATKAVAMPKLAITRLKKVLIPLPPLQEQKRIVAKLDTLFEKIDKAIALHQKNMDEADIFMGSVLNDVFGELEEKYGKTDLKNIAIITMGQSPKSITYNTNGLGMPFFQGKKEFGKLNPTVEKYCTEPKKIAKKGDVLMSVRAPVGPTNIANINCAIGRGLCSIRAKENQFTMYIYYFLNHFEKDIEKMGKGSTFSAINKKETETLKVPSVSLTIQQKTVSYLDSISQKTEKLKAVQKEKMQSLIALKASILDQAFRGEL